MLRRYHPRRVTKKTTHRDLTRMRARMDRLNASIAAALQRRARLAREIGRRKAGLGLPGPDPAREREMLRRTLDGAPPGFSRAELARLLRTVFAASRRLVQRDRR